MRATVHGDDITLWLTKLPDLHPDALHAIFRLDSGTDNLFDQVWNPMMIFAKQELAGPNALLIYNGAPYPRLAEVPYWESGGTIHRHGFGILGRRGHFTELNAMGRQVLTSIYCHLVQPLRCLYGSLSLFLLLQSLQSLQSLCHIYSCGEELEDATRWKYVAVCAQSNIRCFCNIHHTSQHMLNINVLHSPVDSWMLNLELGTWLEPGSKFGSISRVVGTWLACNICDNIFAKSSSSSKPMTHVHNLLQHLQYVLWEQPWKSFHRWP